MRARVVALDALTPGQASGWAALASGAVEPNPFYELAAVQAAAALLPDGERVAVLLVQDGADVLLALPVLRRQRLRRIPVSALAAWQHDYCFAGAPLLRRGREREAWIEALDHLRHSAQEPWLVLERLPLHGPAALALQAVLAGRHVRPAVTDVYGRPVLRRRPEPTYLDARISARHRKSLRRQRRRLGEALGGDIDLVDLAASGAAGDGVETFLALEAAGWKGRAGTALARRPTHAAFFRSFCAELASQGRLEVWAFGTPERPAAVQINALAGGTVFHVKTTYDEQVSGCSPGMQLELQMVEQFHLDPRLDLIDSCVDPGNLVSTQLYPDRDVLATLAVPLRLPTGAAAVTAFRAVTWGRDARQRRATGQDQGDDA